MEEVIMLRLSKWLDKNGFEVFWNKSNDYGFESFGISGTNKKPDLYIRCVENPMWYNSVMEVKPPTDFDVRKGAKILDYWKEYVTGSAEYSIGGSKVLPKYFLLGTTCSIEGKLFDSDYAFQPINPDGNRKKVIEMGLLPKTEYIETFNFVRHLWATWRDVYQRVPGTAVGILLSDMLDGGSGRPAFMYQIFNYEKNRWIQRWRKFS